MKRLFILIMLLFIFNGCNYKNIKVENENKKIAIALVYRNLPQFKPEKVPPQLLVEIVKLFSERDFDPQSFHINKLYDIYDQEISDRQRAESVLKLCPDCSYFFSLDVERQSASDPTQGVGVHVVSRLIFYIKENREVWSKKLRPSDSQGQNFVNVEREIVDAIKSGVATHIPTFVKKVNQLDK